MKKQDEDMIIAREKATWQTYVDKRADDFKKLVSPDLVAMNANGVTNLQEELETMSNSETKSFAFSDVKVVTPDANTAIFTIVNAALIEKLPYKDPQRLVAVWEENARRPGRR